MNIFKLPLWTKYLPDSARLMSKDVAPIFGYKDANSLTSSFKSCNQPAPDGVIKRPFGKDKKSWSMGYLRRLELACRDELNEKA